MDRISPTLKSTGVGHFGPKFRGLPLGVWCLGSAVSEHPRLTNHEIISEEFQPVWSQSTNVSDGQTGSETDDMRSQDRALHLHRAVKKWKFKSWYAAEKVLPDWQVNLLEMSSLYSHTKAMTLTPLFDCVVNHTLVQPFHSLISECWPTVAGCNALLSVTGWRHHLQRTLTINILY